MAGAAKNEARKRIAEAREARSLGLDLGDLALAELPDELGELDVFGTPSRRA